VALGMAFGIGQIGSQFVQKRPIEVMQWMSLIAVLAAGVATLISHDPRFVMVKPSLIYIMVGVIMLKPGWMNRYLPAIREKLSDIAVIFGLVWSGLMSVSAALNLLVALLLSIRSRIACHELGALLADFRHREAVYRSFISKSGTFSNLLI
jgi:intracellular septation protein